MSKTATLLSILLVGAGVTLPAVAAPRGVAQARPDAARLVPAGSVLRTGERGAPRYVSGALSAPRPAGVSAEAHARAFAARYAAAWGLTDPGRQLQLIEVRTDRVGGQHVLFRQLQDGIPVERGMMSVHLDAQGVIRTVNARIVPGLTSTADGLLSEPEAREILADELGGLLVDAAPGELFVRTTSATTDIVAYRVPTFLVDDAQGQVPVAVWVDARTGVPLFGEDPILRGDVEVSGPGVHGEVLTVNGFEGRNFRLDVSPILRMYVQQAEKGAYNLVDQTTRSLGWIYTWDSNETFMMDNEYVHSSDTTFDNPVDPGQPAGISAHYNARRTVDYYDERYGRRGLDDNGMSVASLVQISDPVPSYPLEINAGWVGYGYDFMIYGAGGEWPPDSGVQWVAFSGALDVIGHELNHGVGEFTVNLGYEHESGALNEHLADTFGISTQAYYEGLDWLVGEGLFAEPAYPYDAVRSFEDPTLYGQPDRMSTFAAYPLSYDAGGVHFNSGIANKAYYLAVQGGTFNGVRVSPIAADPDEALLIAGDIWYDVLVNRRVDPQSQLIDMRQATLDAAAAVYPSAVTTLRAAWDAVEVTDAFYPDATVDTTEPNDYKGQAVSIGVGEETQGLLWNRADCDMYAVTGEGPVDIILTDLAGPARMSVYKPFLYGTMNEQGASDNDDTLDEAIHIELKKGDTYYVEVMVSGSGTGSTTAPYTLKILPG